MGYDITKQMTTPGPARAGNPVGPDYDNNASGPEPRPATLADDVREPREGVVVAHNHIDKLFGLLDEQQREIAALYRRIFGEDAVSVLEKKAR